MSPKIRATSVIKKTGSINNRPFGENSPNPVTLLTSLVGGRRNRDTFPDALRQNRDVRSTHLRPDPETIALVESTSQLKHAR
jgi:hypothetical protein